MDFFNSVKKWLSVGSLPEEKLEEHRGAKIPLPKEFITSMGLANLKSVWADSHMNEIENVYDTALNNWRKKRQSSFALVGFKDQGKSIMLEKLGEGKSVLNVRCWPKVLTQQDLTALLPDLMNKELDANGQREIVMLDDCQNLFLRTSNGFEALNFFLQLMSKTWDKVFWVTAWDRAAWAYLDHIMDIAKFFTSVVYLKPVKAGEMKKVVSSVANTVGYQLTHSEDYFSGVVSDNRGLIAACRYWIVAGATVQGQKQIELTLPKYHVDGLYHLNERETYALAGLLQNDCITARQMAPVINEAEMISEQLLAKLSRLHLCNNRDGVYYLNAAYLPQILSFLDQQRFLYIPV